ncbi:carbohydrate ABC transporter permease [Variovorax sp. LG9.2]|jgi:ABC-type glycerol-3-phosphate transport system permease component|uniref:carbohydrate ABC transporter permease n=1 Tax=Variovorax sp. LG9.2 TaxID=3048626 RepID=UPI002B232BAA|nr:carbohydrate ABC transporter permease [Variovorax sp. LG9.2]MEB0055712.1 carbohydrate ABC transporter permease [Variovorax sp. LG9.2]
MTAKSTSSTAKASAESLAPPWQAARHLTLIVCALVFLFPVVWLLLTGFKPYAELFVSPPTLLPLAPTLINFSEGWAIGGGKGIGDSLIVGSISTLLCLLLGFPAAYALARHFPATGQLSFTILSLRMLPPIVPVIGFYLLYQELALFDTYTGLVIVYTFMNLPLVIWLLAEFIRQIPRTYEDAARIDGAPWYRMFLDILLPMALPGIVTAGILSMMFAWNEFLFSLVLTGETVITLPKALASFFLFQQPNWGQLGAIGILAIGPLLVLSYYMQRYLIRSFSAGLGGR